MRRSRIRRLDFNAGVLSNSAATSNRARKMQLHTKQCRDALGNKFRHQLAALARIGSRIGLRASMRNVSRPPLPLASPR